MFAVSPAGYRRMLTVCHIAIARAIKSRVSIVTGLSRSVDVLAGL